MGGGKETWSSSQNSFMNISYACDQAAGFRGMGSWPEMSSLDGKFPTHISCIP